MQSIRWLARNSHEFRYLPFVLSCTVLALASGCSISLFNTTHEHKEPKQASEHSQAIAHRVEVLEQRMNAVEQKAPAAGSAETPSSGLTVPASGVEPAQFEDSAPTGNQRRKKGSKNSREQESSDSASSGLQESTDSLDEDSQPNELTS